MRRKRLIRALAVPALIAAGAGLWLVLQDSVPNLETADRVTLLSIDGRDRKVDAPPLAGETVHGYPLLGRVEIYAPDERRRLGDALREGLRGRGGSWAACYWPRHVLRVERGWSVTEYVICFQCGNYQRYVNGERRVGGQFGEAVRPAFDEPLKAAGVPIAPE
ncbi:MAG: hypothetical protein U0871_00090 [Gemmataceae bacterium]